MPLSSDIISQFTKVTNDSKSSKPDIALHGTVVMYDEKPYVKIDGSDELTPVARTVEVAEGDRVEVSIKNHTAIITGNTTDPSIGIKRAGDLETNISQTAEEIRLEAKNTREQLEASISVTAGEIRSEVSDAVNGLDSKISQTAGEIRSEVSDEVNRLNSSITQNADSIVTLVEQQDENERKFTQITTDVEGIKVEYTGSININDKFIVDKDGTVTWTVDNSPVQVQYSVNGASGWHDTPTSNDLYARYSYDGGTTWTNAIRIQGVDGNSVEAQYSVDGVSDWHETFTGSDYYARYSYDGGKTWTSPVKIQGNDVLAQYSVNGASWHDFYQSTDYYMRYSYDGGKTWTDAIRIRGEDGEDGTDGRNGSDASVTYANIKSALNKAYQAGQQGFVQIEDDKILSPIIYGGHIVGTKMYAGNSMATFSTIDADGFKLYCSDEVEPKATIKTDAAGSNIKLIIGAGDEHNAGDGDGYGYNRLIIHKTSSYVDIRYLRPSSIGGNIGLKMMYNTGEILVRGTLKTDPNASDSHIIATFA